MSYLFDSDVCIDVLRGKNSEAVEKFKNLNLLECLTSAVVEAELRVGVEKKKSEKLLKKVEMFLDRFSILPVDSQIAKKYAEIRAAMEKNGKTVSSNDLFIAATAIHYDLILLTRNERDYRRVPGLKIELVSGR